MKSLKDKSVEVYKPLLLLMVMIILATCTSRSVYNSTGSQKSIAIAAAAEPSKQDISSDSFDIHVNISYQITLDDKVKAVNPNIIKATRQAIFDYDCNDAKFYHYNGFSINNDVYIFEVNQTSIRTWEVKFWVKPQNSNSYNKNGYSFATVEEQKSGSFLGSIMNPGGPIIRAGETF